VVLRSGNTVNQGTEGIEGEWSEQGEPIRRSGEYHKWGPGLTPASKMIFGSFWA